MVYKKNFFSIFTLVTVMGFAQSQGVAKYANYLHEKPLGDSIIYADRVGNIQLGGKISDLLLNQVPDEHEGEYFYKQGDDVILSYWSKDQKNITGITIYSPILHFKNGICVGSSIAEILKHHENLVIQKSIINDEEYFSIPQGKDNQSLICYLKSSDGNILGDYPENSYQLFSEQFRKNGVVSRIEIIQIY